MPSHSHNHTLQHVAITGVGPDSPGIVAGITHVLYEHNANIEDSSMTLLGNQFALIIIASLPALVGGIETLKEDFKPMERALGMRVFIQEIQAEDFQATHSEQSGIPAMITVSGHDRTGLTYRVSQLLAQYAVNITDLNAQIIPGEDGQVYIMVIETQVPASLDQRVLEEALSRLGRELNVEIHYRLLEEIAM